MRTFRWFGTLSARFGHLIIAIWVLVAVGVFLTAPSLSDVSKAGDAEMLPSDIDSIRAQIVQKENFGTSESLSSGIVVLHRDGGLTAEDDGFARDLIGWLKSEKGPRNVDQVVSVVDNENLKSVLSSADGSTTMIRVGFRSEPATKLTADAMEDIRGYLKGHPQGATANLTGGTAIIVALKKAGADSVDRTTPWTIGLVIVILFVIYRSPVAPVIPLLTIGLSFFVSRGATAFLGQHTNVSSLTEQFLVAVLFGAGTDYCLFLVSRFGEELASGLTKEQAIVRTMERVGAAITSSAATVIFGLAFTLLALFGLFSKSGPFIALGVAITLLAGLTLSPAMMSVLGEKMFWPVHPSQHVDRPGLWARFARFLAAKPVLVLVVSVAILLPSTSGMIGLKKDFDYLNSLPRDNDTVAGFEVIKRSFGEGEMLPTSVLVKSENGWAASLDKGEQLAQDLATLANVKTVRSATRPLGQTIPYDQVAPLLSNPGLLAMIPDPNLKQQAQAAVAGIKSYLSPDGRWLRLDVVLEEKPYSNEAIDSVATMRDGVRSSLQRLGLGGAEFHLSGAMPTAADVRAVTDRDTVVLTSAVLVGVFVILVLLLRSLVAPVNLILTILLSYLSTLGMTALIFQHWAGAAGLSWAAPLFTFIMLVALGEDYNIFVMSRVKEEVAETGLTRGVVRAVERTGQIITSCGLILAGTFGVMMISPMTEVRQIGFAICFGILLDTFVVRSAMVPALVLLVGRWNWWPRRMITPEEGKQPA